MLNHFSKPSCMMVPDAAEYAAGGRVIAGSSSIQLAVSVMDARCVTAAVKVAHTIPRQRCTVHTIRAQ